MLSLLYLCLQTCIEITVIPAKLTSPRNGFTRFFWNTLRASVWVDFLNSVLMSFPIICCAGSAVCLSVLFHMCPLKKKKGEKNEDIPRASSEAGLRYCTCKNLFSLKNAALDDCYVFSIESQQGPLEFSGPASCLKGTVTATRSGQAQLYLAFGS